MELVAYERLQYRKQRSLCIWLSRTASGWPHGGLLVASITIPFTDNKRRMPRRLWLLPMLMWLTRAARQKGNAVSNLLAVWRSRICNGRNRCAAVLTCA